MEHKQITEKIIGCAYKVYNTMGAGFLESVYEKCMLIELEKAGIKAGSQVPITVFYKDNIVGSFVADIFVEDCVIVELKAVHKIVKAHEVQLVNYLTATKIETGLIINFSDRQVEVKRKSRILPAAVDSLSSKSC